MPTRHLRQLLHIKWRDKVAEVKFLKRVGTDSVEALRRIPDECIPKLLLYEEMQQEKRETWGTKTEI